MHGGKSGRVSLFAPPQPRDWKKGLRANHVQRKEPHPMRGGRSGRASSFKPKKGGRPAGLTKKAPETPPDVRRQIGQSFLFAPPQPRDGNKGLRANRGKAKRDDATNVAKRDLDIKVNPDRGD